ncbi:MAG: hypothetical protein RSE93_00995 [Oscillospiraceae bacterium]
MNKKIIIILFLLVTALIFVFNYPFTISHSVDALEINLGDNDYFVKREILLNGTYHFNLFNKDVFSGEVMVSGYESDYNEYAMVDCEVSAKNGSPLIWEQKRDEKTNTKVFGTIFANRFFTDITVLIGPSHDFSEGIIVVTNVETVKDAKEKAEKIFIGK